MKHYLKDHQILQLDMLSKRDKFSIHQGLEIIKAYIFDRTGAIVGNLKADPLLMFEKFCTIACSYFNASANEIQGQSQPHVAYTTNSDDLTKEQMDFLRSQGVHI